MNHHKPLSKMIEHLRQRTPDTANYAPHRAALIRLSALADSVMHLESLARAPSPTETGAAHSLRVAENGLRLLATAEKMQLALADLARAGVVALDGLIDETAGLREDAYAAEIRAASRSMSKKARDDALLTAVNAGDGRTVAALTSGPPIVSGFTGGLQARMRDAYRRTHAPAESQALADLHDLVSSSASAIALAQAAASAATDPAYIAQVRAEQQSALTAQSAFDATLSYQSSS